jgi:hypothetical protein
MAKASKGKETAPAGPQPVGSVFNTLQFIALGALIGSVLLLWMALSNYGFKLTAN